MLYPRKAPSGPTGQSALGRLRPSLAGLIVLLVALPGAALSEDRGPGASGSPAPRLALQGAARSGVPASRPRGETPGLGPNLLTNGNFSSQTSGWTLARGGEGRATVEWMPSQGPPAAPDGAVRIDVTAVGTQPWHVQFYQGGLNLKEGEIYTLTFWARGDRDRPFRAAANVTSGNGHGIGLTADRLRVTRDWRKFNLVFTASEVVENRCRITFVLGTALGCVDLAGVELRPGLPGKAAGRNLLRNADFRADGADWRLELGGGGAAMARVEYRDDPEVERGKIAHFEIQRLGTQSWHVQFVQPGLDLLEGEPYLLTFWARAEETRPMSVHAILDMPDWHAVGLTGRVRLTPDWQQYRLAFTANGTVAEHSRLSLILGEALGTVEMHSLNLRHHPVEVPTASTPHPLLGTWTSRSGATDQHSFTFNADGTGSLRTGSESEVSSVPRKPVLYPFRWYVDDKGLILAGKRHTWSVAPEGDQERLILKRPPDRTYVLYRPRKAR